MEDTCGAGSEEAQQVVGVRLATRPDPDRYGRVEVRAATPAVTEQEFEALLEEGERAGVFEEEERELVGRALRLDDRRVCELMTPRPRIVWLNTEDPRRGLLGNRASGVLGSRKPMG